MKIVDEKTNKKYKKILILSILVLMLSFIISFFSGRITFSLNQISNFIFNKAYDYQIVNVLFNIRLPRILGAIIIGSSLAIAGATMQGVVLNPLASPDVLGTSDAAAFGAALSIILFDDNNIITNFLSLFFGILSIAIIYLLVGLKRSFNIVNILLSGIIVSSLFKALTMGTQYISNSSGEDKMPAITFWLMGSLTNITNKQLVMVSPIIFLAILIIMIFRWKLNILSLGDDLAKLSGVHPLYTKLILLFFSATLVSTTVILGGVIGWVGLVIPHFTRKIIGENHGVVLPLSGFFGAIFLLWVDTLCRTITASEIPIGVLTALIGVPIFLIIFYIEKGK